MDFDGLIDRYEKPIYDLIYRLVGDREEAADLAQETFVAAFKSFHAFRGQSSAYTWLYRIAVNKCKNKFKANDRRSRHEGPSMDQILSDRREPVSPAAAAAADRPDAALQRKELIDQVERAISELPPDYRIVAVLRDLHGLSYEDVARAADLSVDVVRTRLARARGMLRQKLEHYLVE